MRQRVSLYSFHTVSYICFLICSLALYVTRLSILVLMFFSGPLFLVRDGFTGIISYVGNSVTGIVIHGCCEGFNGSGRGRVFPLCSLYCPGGMLQEN
jgi:hypothetical protein